MKFFEEIDTKDRIAEIDKDLLTLIATLQQTHAKSLRDDGVSCQVRKYYRRPDLFKIALEIIAFPHYYEKLEDDLYRRDEILKYLEQDPKNDNLAKALALIKERAELKEKQKDKASTINRRRNINRLARQLGKTE